MKITIIVDNHGNTAFHPEFGLSLLIQEKDLEYLFDTGAGVALYPNLVLLKKDLTSIRYYCECGCTGTNTDRLD